MRTTEGTNLSYLLSLDLPVVKRVGCVLALAWNEAIGRLSLLV